MIKKKDIRLPQQIMKYAKSISLFLLLCLLVNSVSAYNTSLASIFRDNMVLQRDMEIPVWGWALPGENIEIKFNGQHQKTRTNDLGKWEIRLNPMPSNSEPMTMTITGKQVIEIKNILIGDVWICSGQSNMDFILRNTLDASKEAKNATYPMIRLFKVERRTAMWPQTHCIGKWTVCSPKTAKNFTAVGYFFARRLHRELDVPIGIINPSWGGTRIEPWTPAIGFKHANEPNFTKKMKSALASRNTEAELAADINNIESWLKHAKEHLAAKDSPDSLPAMISTKTNNNQHPTSLYNAMVAPIVPYAIRGVTWYQGESNRDDGAVYYHMKHALVKGWREVWGQGDFSFYWVQLTSYTADKNNPEGGDGFTQVREAQVKALDIPNTGVAITIDAGDTKDIHPKNKQDVGFRLAQWALCHEYKKDVVAGGPRYASHKIEENKIRVTFFDVGDGLMIGAKQGLAPVEETPDETLKRFAIAGEDRQWKWAEAKIEGNTVVLSHPDITQPIAASYAYSANPIGANLYNKDGFPASPFLTQ